MIDRFKKKRTSAIRNYGSGRKAAPANGNRKRSALRTFSGLKGFIKAPKGKSPGRRPGKFCCPEFFEIRNFYAEAAAQIPPFSQISFDVNTPQGPLTVFVDSPDWFNERDCSILLNVNSNVLGIPDAIIDCRTLRLIYANNLTRVV